MRPAVFAIVVAAMSHGVAAAEPAGVWQTSFGTLELVAHPEHHTAGRFEGRYDTPAGSVFANLAGDVLEGYWVQDTAQVRCGTAAFGTFYWGRMSFTFEGDGFTGQWSYCDAAPRDAWNGVLIERAGLPPARGAIPPVPSRAGR